MREKQPRNSRVRKGEGGGAPGAGAEIHLRTMEETMVEQVFISLQPTERTMTEQIFTQQPGVEESTLCRFPKEQQPMEREDPCWIRGKMRGGMRTDHNPLNCFCGDREIGNESVAEPGKRLVRGVVVLKFCPCFSVSGPTLIRNKINFPQVESVWLMIVTIK